MNCFLLWQVLAQPQTPAPGPAAIQPPPASALPSPQPPLERAPVADWNTLFAGNFQQLRSRLAAAGCPEPAIQIILTHVIDQAYRPRLVALFSEWKEDFWEDAVLVKSRRNVPADPRKEAARKEFGAVLQERDQLMKSLVRPDYNRRSSPDGQDSQGDPRLSFLSEEKRLRLQAHQREISDLRLALRQQGLPETEVQAQVREREAVQKTERAELLTPAELQEYQLRFSRYNHVVQNLYGFEANPEERRAIIELMEFHQGKIPGAELNKALGPARSAQYQRARDSAYEHIYKVGRHLELDDARINRVFDLKQAAEAAAGSIRGTELDLARKNEELRSLRLQTLERLTQEFGAAGRDLYLLNGGWWINQLAPD